MRFVDADEIRRVLTFSVLVAGMEAAHRRRKIDVLDGSLGNEAGHYFVRHAVDHGRFMASKLFTSFPQNLAQGIPAVQAVCVVFDGINGKPRALLAQRLSICRVSGTGQRCKEIARRRLGSIK